MAVPTYANFDLLVERSGDGYRARLVTSPVCDEAESVFTLAAVRSELAGLTWLPEAFRTRLERAFVLIEPESRRSAVPPTPAQVGTRLYEALFAGTLGECFRRSLDHVRQAGQGLRIRLRFHRSIPELAQLPWELMYAPELDRFVSLSGETVIVRYIEVNLPHPSLAVAPPLRLLAVTSDPVDAERLDIGRELQSVQQAVAPLQANGTLTLEQLPDATLEALLDRLRTDDVHILHFIGHGYFAEDAGGLVFEDADGRSHLVDAARLGTLLHDRQALRVVFLNACQGAAGAADDAFSGTAQKLVQQGVTAVAAMQFPVSDAAAIVLARTFYRALAGGYPVDGALAEARKAVYLAGSAWEWGTPVLFLRAADGEVWNMQKQEEPSIMESSREDDWLARLGGTGGRVNVTRIEGSKNIVVGDHNVQKIYEIPGPPTPDDKQIVEQQLAKVSAALHALQAQIGASKAEMAGFQLDLLQGELTKTTGDEQPSAATITKVAGWLLDNVPDLAEALAALFATPAVGRVVGRAGQAAVAWVKSRFGGTDNV